MRKFIIEAYDLTRVGSRRVLQNRLVKVTLPAKNEGEALDWAKKMIKRERYEVKEIRH